MERSDIFVNSLQKHADAMHLNFDAVKTKFSKTHLVAEMSCNLLDQLFSNEFNLNQESLSDVSVKMMLFGVYHSWVYSYILTGAAISDIGLITLRRAIEFTCYIAKTHKSDDRARIWRDQTSGLENRKKFKSIFSIPQAYFSEKYHYLRPLLVCHDVISNTATHANFDMIGSKWNTSKDVFRLDMSFQDQAADIPLMIATVLTTGNLIVDVLITILKDSLGFTESFRESLNGLKQMFRASRVEMADYQYKGRLPNELINMIQNEIIAGNLGDYFEKLKSSYAIETQTVKRQ